MRGDSPIRIVHKVPVKSQPSRTRLTDNCFPFFFGFAYLFTCLNTADVAYINRATGLIRKTDCTRYALRLTKFRSGIILIFWFKMPSSGFISIFVENIRIFRMYQNKHTAFPGCLQAIQKCHIVRVHFCPLKTEKQLQRGNSHLHQLRKLTLGFFGIIRAACMQCDIRSKLTLDSRIQPVITGIDQI